MLSKAATEALKAANVVADMLSQAATEALKATNDVADMSKAAATEKKNNSEYLLKSYHQNVSWDVKVFL